MFFQMNIKFMQSNARLYLDQTLLLIYTDHVIKVLERDQVVGSKGKVGRRMAPSNNAHPFNVAFGKKQNLKKCYQQTH